MSRTTYVFILSLLTICSTFGQSVHKKAVFAVSLDTLTLFDQSRQGKSPRPKKPSVLPKVIAAEDIKRLFAATPNLKHNTMLKLCYGMGLRVSEIVNLKITDIDSKNMQVFVERAKGKKDRYVNLPESILGQLREYYRTYRPKKYLFEGQYGDKYSKRTIQEVFKQALRKAKVNKSVGIHGLRHSFATHLMDNGTDVKFIQELLGHTDIKTTLRYTHVSQKNLKNIRSPLDNL